MSYDVPLIEMRKKTSEHIAVVYNFSLSEERFDQWWWHLDKLASGEIGLRLNPEST